MSIQSTMENYARKVLKTVAKTVEVGISVMEVGVALNEAGVAIAEYAISTPEAQEVFEGIKSFKEKKKEYHKRDAEFNAVIEEALVKAGFVPNTSNHYQEEEAEEPAEEEEVLDDN